MLNSSYEIEDSLSIANNCSILPITIKLFQRNSFSKQIFRSTDQFFVFLGTSSCLFSGLCIKSNCSTTTNNHETVLQYLRFRVRYFQDLFNLSIFVVLRKRSESNQDIENSPSIASNCSITLENYKTSS